LASVQAREAQRRLRLRQLLNQPPRTLLSVFGRVTRFGMALALTIPVICGTTLAWWETDRLNWLALAFNLCALLGVALGVNALTEYDDYRRASRSNVVTAPAPLATGYGLMMHGKFSPVIALNLGYILFAVGAMCCLWLALLAGWPSLFFSGLSLLLLYGYANPPLHYSGAGWGLGELGLFLSYGLLQLLNSYFVQSQTLSSLAVAISVPFGLLALVLFFNYNFLFERRDWLMRKRTLVVDLKTPRALDVSATLILLAYIAILLIVSMAHLPLLTLLTMLALPTALGGFSQLRRELLTSEDSFHLYKTTVQAMIWTGLLFSAALMVNKLF
jgi:1,4-dihydroxy-2-naphthoate octaprenyltransferase